MTPTELASLEALAKAATPGPWTHYRNKLRPNFGGVINEVQCREARKPIVQWRGFDDSERSEKKHSANAVYTAAALLAAEQRGRDAERAECIRIADEVERQQEIDHGAANTGGASAVAAAIRKGDAT